MNPEIIKARNEYLEKYPYDPTPKPQTFTDVDGTTVEVIDMPDTDQFKAVGIRFAWEFMAHVRTKSDIQNWFLSIMGYAGGVPGAAIPVFLGVMEELTDVFETKVELSPDVNGVLEAISLKWWRTAQVENAAFEVYGSEDGSDEHN